MNDLLAFIKKFKVHFTFIGLVIISLLLISLNVNNRLGGFRSFMIVSISNLQKLVPITLNPATTKNINQELRQLNLELYSDVVSTKAAIKEYNKLKKMVEYQQEQAVPTIVGKVIGKSTIETRTYITIDKGLVDGIQRGMAVRTDAGLVGTVSGVSENNSIIETMKNKHIKVAVKTQRTNTQGIMVWQGGNEMRIEKISSDYDVQSGDIVLTSNMSNKYPIDIPIGQITAVTENPASFFYDITLKPFANFEELEYLFVVNMVPDEERLRLIEEIETNLKNRAEK
jgi:rod shape-determining protein MreC